MTEEQILKLLRMPDRFQRGGPRRWINRHDAEAMEDLGLIETEGGGRFVITDTGRARLEAGKLCAQRL